jgi:hypothetical protein
VPVWHLTPRRSILPYHRRRSQSRLALLLAAQLSAPSLSATARPGHFGQIERTSDLDEDDQVMIGLFQLRFDQMPKWEIGGSEGGGLAISAVTVWVSDTEIHSNY